MNTPNPIKARIVEAVKSFAAGSPRFIEPLGEAARFVEVARVRVRWIAGLAAGLTRFDGQGRAALKFAIANATSGLDFEFHHDFDFEFGGHLEGEDVVIDYAVVRDEDYFEDAAPHPALSEDDPPVELAIPSRDY
jgi:hypothetical protein